MGNFDRGKKFGRSNFSRSSHRDSKRFSRDSDRPERGSFRQQEVEMHSATCDKCGARCEVPFKPSGSKPVYCSDCFRKGENFESKSTDKNKREFDIINEKLDRILDSLRKN